jgi:hypothetical protein
VTSALRDALVHFGIARLFSIDFEFQQPDGDNPRPICLCWRDLLGNESGKIWLWDRRRACPFAMTAGEAFVGYNFSAEAGCFAALGWTRPIQVIDLYFEYLQLRNTWPSAVHAGNKKQEHKDLLSAMRYFGIETHILAGAGGARWPLGGRRAGRHDEILP